jgi:hypothetical protein
MATGAYLAFQSNCYRRADQPHPLYTYTVWCTFVPDLDSQIIVANNYDYLDTKKKRPKFMT